MSAMVCVFLGFLCEGLGQSAYLDSRTHQSKVWKLSENPNTSPCNEIRKKPAKIMSFYGGSTGFVI